MLLSDSHAPSRRTFAIISHPDAGKTTLTSALYQQREKEDGEKLAHRSADAFSSDWMGIEQARGISISTAIIPFLYRSIQCNLLDTPGHEDFSEDTYRTLTAVDSAIMVIDGAKGIESRTEKLIEVLRPRKTPLVSFINKLDRDSLDLVTLIDQVEQHSGRACSPIVLPLGCGQNFKGVYHLTKRCFYPYRRRAIPSNESLFQQEHCQLHELVELNIAESSEVEAFMELAHFIEGATATFSSTAFQQGEQTPLFFGSALQRFGINLLLDAIIDWAPDALPRAAQERTVFPHEKNFSGFVFKIQANMDKRHHDRIAFLRIVSGIYRSGMTLFQVNSNKKWNNSNALSLCGNQRHLVEIAYPGDIIGLHNHGMVKIGETFTEGEYLRFRGIPHFAPELFRSIQLKSTMRQKTLLRGLKQLAEEGAVQLFRPLRGHELYVGAIGALQFEVVLARLSMEYGVTAVCTPTNLAAVRWIVAEDLQSLERFKHEQDEQLGLDGQGKLCYLASSLVKLKLAEARYPKIHFATHCELG